MSSKKYLLIIGLAAFAVTYLVTSLIQSSHPFWASIVVAFLIVEISFFYFIHREKRKFEL